MHLFIEVLFAIEKTENKQYIQQLENYKINDDGPLSIQLHSH